MRKKYVYIVLLFLSLCTNPAIAQRVAVNDIVISGNKTTRKSIILRELTFAKGDTLHYELLQTKIANSHDNLLNTTLFNYVYITDSLIAPSTIDIYVKVEERWYIWPVVDLVFEDRNISTWLRHPDWSRFSFGLGVNIENMRGVNEKLKINARVGYQQGATFSYSNIALDKSRRKFLSFGGGYSRTHSTMYTTENNKPVFVKVDEKPSQERYFGELGYLYRPELREFHSLRLIYERTAINDTILSLNPSYWGINNTLNNSLTAVYYYDSDYRDSYSYPLKGTLWRAGANVTTSLNDKFIFGQLFLKVDTYLPLAQRWFYGLEMYGKLSATNKEAYIYNKALGYETNYLRGYEDYVVDGQHSVLVKNTLRFMLMPTKTFEIKWLSSLYKFNKIHFTIYANIFADMGYAYNKYAVPGNNLQNAFLYSGGAGIDIVTYYDMVFRLDYSVNKMKQGGFYITLITPFF